MPSTDKIKKFKKVPLHKVSLELNRTTDTIVSYLEENGYADALSGSGIRAAITSEDAYLDLLEHYSDDREVHERVVELRSIREAQRAEESIKIEEEELIEVTPPEIPSEIPTEDEDAQSISEPEPDITIDEETDSVPETVEDDTDEVDLTIEESDESISEEITDERDDESVGSDQEDISDHQQVSPSITATEEVVDHLLDSDESTDEIETVEDEPQQIDQGTEQSESEDEAGAQIDEPELSHEEEILSADRYQLQGTKIIGKIDLATVNTDEDPSKRRRTKRKRKRKKVPSTQKSVAQSEDKSTDQSTSTKSKRKRKSKVDSEAVGQSVQETLRSLDQGTDRVRQRRRRARRQQRAEERMNVEVEQEEKSRHIRVTEFISTGELADLMGIPVTEIISMLFSSGMMVSINQRLDADTIAYVADEFDHTIEFITEFGAEEIDTEEEFPEDLMPRAPVVTVMGHVDHGKTSLLDYVRNASVAAGESGGITQHIGAYKVSLTDNRIVTFLDTPGHEAFTAMRARGAKVTDVVILVVAANDSVMPQTIEAINHSKAAGVPLIIAINKIDLDQSDVQRVMKELSDYGVLVEQYGGKVQCAFVSAKTGEGIDDLLEKVILEADLMELKGNPQRQAQGIVIESRLDRGRGNVATVLVQNGTLRVGDPFVAGIYGGRVRAMFDERDNQIKSVGPSEPALVLGLPGQPTVGDQLTGMKEESEAREIAQRRQQIWREQKIRQYKHVRLEDVGRRMALGDFNELNLIIKADVGGSVEAISDSLHKISTDEVAVNIIHAGVGAITESDVMLASASDAVIIGFQVRPTAGARSASEREEIDIRTYSIIYDAIEDIRDALEGLLTPEESEKIIGVAEVREVFKVPKIGAVGGCYISEGRIRRADTVHVLREGIVIYKGRLASLRRFKEDVREVLTGYECGIGVEKYNDIKVGDQIEAFEMVQTKRTLEV
ncbi:MAG: translation initiation factor IF-2 [Bacteroidetes bacterium]|nr:translation initiation factor IF-2 [Bacteroidota bacterium]MCY4232719.1 translation initiation factor IF-2 [Bacteroidota bacterium]